MSLDRKAQVKAQIEAEGRKRIWTLAGLALLGLLALMVLGTFLAFFLHWAQLSEEAKWISPMLLALGVGTAIPLWMNRSPDAKYSRELHRLMDWARIGDVESQRLLALRYLHGTPGIHRSSSEAVHWLLKAAEGGDAEAAYVLAGLLKAGDGVLPDELEARRWLTRAVESGHGPGAERLARWDRGEPEPPPPRAIRSLDPESDWRPPTHLQVLLERLPAWLRNTPLMLLVWVSFLAVAAYILATGIALLLFAYTVSATATLLVGALLLIILALGGTVLFLQRNQDARYPGSSLRLVKRAQAGNTRAQLLLAEAYMEGSRGLSKDASQALWWLQRCAEGGDLQAAYQLAQWIELGMGHHRNRPLAMQWLRRSAEGGYGPAKHLLKHWERRNAAE